MAETVTIGGKTYTKPENAQAGWLADARKAGTTTPVSPVAQPTQTNPVDSPTPITQPSQMDAIKNLPQYQQLIDKGYKADDIEKAVSGYKPPKTQVQQQAEIKPATPIAPVEQVQAQPQEQAKIEPQKEMNKTGTMDLLPVSEYQDNSSERMNQIISNLNQYRQSAPAFLKDLQTFKDTFMVNGVTRTPEQDKNMLNWYAGYKKGEQLSTLTNGNISDMYNAGTVSSNDLENLRLNNPAKYSEVMNEINKKNELKKYSDELYGTEAEPVQQATPLTDPIDNNDVSFFDEYKNTINSDEVKNLNNDLGDKQTKIDQLRLELTSIEDEIRKQYDKTGATESKIGRLVADAQSTVQKQINALGLDYNNTLNKYNSIMNTAADTYKLNLEEANYQNEQRDQKMKELGFYYQYDPKGIAEQATAKYNAENPDIDSTNSATSKQALNMTLDQYYEDYGMIIQRPKSQVINDIQALAKSQGISVSQALKDNFITPLQGKSEYKALVNKALGIEGPEASTRKIETDEDGNISIVQSGTGALPENATRQQTVQAYTGALASAVNSGSLEQVGSTVQNMASDGEKGGQCGYAMNNVSKAIGSDVWFGNTLQSKTKYINSSTPEVGSFVVMDSANSPENGHVGMVTAVNNDGTFTMKSSNYKGDEKRRTDTVNQSSGSIKGYVKPTITAKTNETKEQATEITNLRKEFNNLQTVKDYQKTKQMYNSVETASKLGTAAGDLSLIFAYMKILDPNSTVREGEFANAQNAGGINDKVANAYNKALKGTRLSENQRTDFTNSAKTLFKTYEDQYNQTLNQYRSYSILGGDTSRIGQEFSSNMIEEIPIVNIGSIYSNNSGVGNSASRYDQAMQY